MKKIRWDPIRYFPVVQSFRQRTIQLFCKDDIEHQIDNVLRQYKPILTLIFFSKLSRGSENLPDVENQHLDRLRLLPA